MGRIPLLNLAFVQFSSSAEAGKRGSPASGLSKLSSATEAPAPSTRLGRHRGQVRSTFQEAPSSRPNGRNDRRVSLERR
jgi:hypothetical protein